ncbi:MAG: sulfurtransferase, partial [Ideonella sp.]|nr:sulfurtransferase [Ideonella sp.]
MREIEVTALGAFIEAHAAQSPVLLDVREPWEVALGTIELPGARTLTWPMGTIP